MCGPPAVIELATKFSNAKSAKAAAKKSTVPANDGNRKKRGLPHGRRVPVNAGSASVGFPILVHGGHLGQSPQASLKSNNKPTRQPRESDKITIDCKWW